METDTQEGGFAGLRRRAAGLYVRGLAMGTADVIPGVSGGTLALITGIYDELVGTVAGIDRDLLTALVRGRFSEVAQRANLVFLVPLLAGIFTAIVTLAKGITWLLQHHPVPVWGGLTGLIAASLFVVVRQVRGWNAVAYAAAIVGAVAGYTVTLLVPVETGVEWYKFTGAGLIASVAMILPGISGSFLLVVMGKYQQVLAAVNDRDLQIIVLFGAGFATGILGFSRVLRWLLAHAHSSTMAFLVGLMAGSIRKVWPFRQVLDTPEAGFVCTLPVVWDGTALAAFGLMVVAAAVVLLIERVAGATATRA